MNEYDSELVRSILTQAKYTFTDNYIDADVILLNTCSVRDSATRKVLGQTRELRHDLGAKPLIGILGCMATDFKKDLLDDRTLGVNFVCGPDSYKNLPTLIAQAQNKERPMDITLDKTIDYGDIYPQRQPGVNAWVAITRGCNNFCTFCIVPYARGRERSRRLTNILKEVKKLVADGYPQVTLLGQNVNSYKDGTTDFPSLLDKISQVKGLKRIRFMSPHPKDFSSALIDLIAERPNICKHVHLPLQSGNNRILKLMNRCYTKNDYLSLVDKLRVKCPQIALTTDVIVGFPTETKKDFKDTLGVLEKVRFDSAFIFKYSPRNGTVAQRQYTDDVAPGEKTERIVHLNKVQKKISLSQNEKLLGQTLEVMVEECILKCWRGRTDTNKVVSLSGIKTRAGELISVKITNASANGLSGRILTTTLS